MLNRAEQGWAGNIVASAILAMSQHEAVPTAANALANACTAVLL